MTITLPNGIGGTQGDQLVVGGQYTQLSTTLLYVSSLIGNNANDGKTREQPKATLDAARAASSQYGTIVCLAGHAEVLTNPINFVTEVTVVGEGLDNGKPAASFQGSGGTAGLFLLNAEVMLKNLRFLASQPGSDIPFVTPFASKCRIYGCYFEFGNDDGLTGGILLKSAGQGTRILDCTFVSTATTSPPFAAVSNVAGGIDVEISNCTFDGGTIGWAVGCINFTAAFDDIRMEALTLLRGSRVAVTSTSHGYIHIATATGGSVLELT